RPVELEQAAHHQLNLRFFRIARTDHGLLDLARGVFEYFDFGICRAANGRTARLSQLQGAVRIAVYEDLLDGDLVRLILLDDGLHAAEDFTQPGGKIGLAGADDTACDVREARTRGIQDAEAGTLRARIDAEHADGRDLTRVQFDSS